MERLCINCNHYKKSEWSSSIVCDALNDKVNPVTGNEVTGIEPGIMRLTLCGWNDPKFWERKYKVQGEKT